MAKKIANRSNAEDTKWVTDAVWQNMKETGHHKRWRVAEEKPDKEIYDAPIEVKNLKIIDIEKVTIDQTPQPKPKRK